METLIISCIIIFEILNQLIKCLGYLAKPDSVLDSVEVGSIYEQNKCNSCPLKKKNTHFHNNLLGMYFPDKRNITLSSPFHSSGQALLMYLSLYV